MALLGQSINPALFVQDYSGFTKAAAIQAQGMQNLGQQIQGIAQDYTANKKEESKLNAIAKVGKTQLESALNLYGDKIPGLREKLAPTIAAFADPNRSAVEKAALAQVAGDELNNYLNFSLKQQELGVNERVRQTSALATAARDRATEAYRIAQLQAKDETSYKESTITQDVNGETYTKNVLLDPSTGSRYDPDTMIRIGDTVKYMSGQSGWEGGQAPTTTQNVSFNSANLSQGLKPLSSAFEDAGRAYNVPPALLAAIAELETGNGTSSAFINKKNAMGVSDKTGPISFGSPVESIYKMASLLGQGINEGTGPYAGVKSIQDIANIYAPVGAENDPNGTNSSWASGVAANIQRLSGQPPQAASATNITAASENQTMPRGAKKAAPPSLKETPTEKVQAQRLLGLDKTQSELRDSGLASRQEIQPLTELRSLLDKDVETGTFADFKYGLKKATGIDVSSTEEFKARAGEFAMKNIELTKGAISDKEMTYFKTELSPYIGKTNEGNKKVIDFKLKYAERAAKISDEISKMQSVGASPFEIEAQVKSIIDSNPLIPKLGEPGAPPLSASDRLKNLQRPQQDGRKN